MADAPLRAVARVLLLAGRLRPTVGSPARERRSRQPSPARRSAAAQPQPPPLPRNGCPPRPQPTDRNVEAYVREYVTHNVKHLVRTCDPTYNTARVTSKGIKVHELAYPDGDPPPSHVIDSWLDLCERAFKGGNPGKDAITVHCVAGLGRAPVLVAIALIEDGVEPADAIEIIREKRASAFNRRQVAFLLEDYERRRGGSCCTVS